MSSLLDIEILYITKIQKSLSAFKTVHKPAEYIGSFLVNGNDHSERAEIVRQKLEAAKAYTHSKPIVLVVSLNGIKVCSQTEDNVYMAHALRRISYATCDPDFCQFAFLAREPKSQPNVQYCHAFVTQTSNQAEDLNNVVGEAFRLAYAQQRISSLVIASATTPVSLPADLGTTAAPGVSHAGQLSPVIELPPSLEAFDEHHKLATNGHGRILSDHDARGFVEVCPVTTSLDKHEVSQHLTNDSGLSSADSACRFSLPGSTSKHASSALPDIEASLELRTEPGSTSIIPISPNDRASPRHMILVKPLPPPPLQTSLLSPIPSATSGSDQAYLADKNKCRNEETHKLFSVSGKSLSKTEVVVELEGDGRQDKKGDCSHSQGQQQHHHKRHTRHHWHGEQEDGEFEEKSASKSSKHHRHHRHKHQHHKHKSRSRDDHSRQSATSSSSIATFQPLSDTGHLNQTSHSSTVTTASVSAPAPVTSVSPYSTSETATAFPLLFSPSPATGPTEAPLPPLPPPRGQSSLAGALQRPAAGGVRAPSVGSNCFTRSVDHEDSTSVVLAGSLATSAAAGVAVQLRRRHQPALELLNSNVISGTSHVPSNLHSALSQLDDIDADNYDDETDLEAELNEVAEQARRSLIQQEEDERRLASKEQVENLERPCSQNSYDIAQHSSRCFGNLVTPATPRHLSAGSSINPVVSLLTGSSSSTAGLCSSGTNGSTGSTAFDDSSLQNSLIDSSPRQAVATSQASLACAPSINNSGPIPPPPRRGPRSPDVSLPASVAWKPTGSSTSHLDGFGDCASDGGSSGRDGAGGRRSTCRLDGDALMDENKEAQQLAKAAWYQPNLPRELALEMLAKQPPGSFIVRDSSSHANCFALSVRIGEGNVKCLSSGMLLPSGGISGSGSGVGCGSNNSSTSFGQFDGHHFLPATPSSISGISHYLVERTAQGFKLKGLDKEWPSLSCLVLHLTVMPEMLPCPLRLPRDAANPAFSPSDQALPAGINQCNSHGHAHLEQAIGLSHFRPIASAIGGGPGVVLAGAGRQLSTALTTNDGLFGVIPDALAMTFASTNVEEEDDDYHRLSDFSSIMADLQLHSRGPPRRLPSTKGSLQFVPANNENR